VSLSNVRVVVFDLGRVLVPLCDNWKHAAELAKTDALRELSDHERTRLRQLVVESETGRMSQAEFCYQASLVFGIDPKHTTAISDIYLLGVYPGAGELLNDLESAGIQTACLSNTNDNHWRIIFENSDPVYQPLLRLRHRFGSHLIGVRKPDPKIYRYVEDATGFKASQLLFFDDLPENIEAARKLGWLAEQVVKDGDPIRQMRAHLSRLGVLGR
jgi:putative hydrolase of the HAD superfamily